MCVVLKAEKLPHGKSSDIGYYTYMYIIILMYA